MTVKEREDKKVGVDRLKYALRENANTAEILGFSAAGLGQSYPQHCPQLEGISSDQTDGTLGEPMNIREVARVLGCSEWTIRQQYIPRGLPCFRLSPREKLLFFHNQIVRWVLERQRQKGGLYK